MSASKTLTTKQWNDIGANYLPGYLGITVTKVTPDKVIATMPVTKDHLAPHQFMHAGAIITMADTCCGYGTMASLPDGATTFTTVELKSNHLSTVQDGEVTCVATPLHQGRSTQVWDATVTASGTGKVLAHFRCTQMILWPD